MKMRMSMKRNLLLYLAILIAIIAIFSFIIPTTQKPTEISLDTAIVMSQNNEIEKLVIDDAELLVIARDGAEFKANIRNLNYVDLQELGLSLKGIDYEIKESGFNWGGALLNFLPLLIFGALLFFIFRSARGANSQALTFGRSRARLFPANTPTITFNDVAGVEEAKIGRAHV